MPPREAAGSDSLACSEHSHAYSRPDAKQLSPGWCGPQEAVGRGGRLGRRREQRRADPAHNPARQQQLRPLTHHRRRGGACGGRVQHAPRPAAARVDEGACGGADKGGGDEPGEK